MVNHVHIFSSNFTELKQAKHTSLTWNKLIVLVVVAPPAGRRGVH